MNYIVIFYSYALLPTGLQVAATPHHRRHAARPTHRTMTT